MGRNKALLEYRATTLLQHQVALLRRFCEHVVVSGAYPDYDCVHDIRPGMGPLSGMHAAAKRFDGDTLLFLHSPCPAYFRRSPGWWMPSSPCGVPGMTGMLSMRCIAPW